MALIVELLIVWAGMSVLLGLPLGRVIQRADSREFPLRGEPWWSDDTDGRHELDRPAVDARALSV